MEGLDIPTLETARLRLRPFRRSDFDDYAALHADPEVMRYLGGGVTWDRGRSWRHMAFLMGHWDLAGNGMWVLELLETGEFVGIVGFAEPEGASIRVAERLGESLLGRRELLGREVLCFGTDRASYESRNWREARAAS